jgi:hypothetical protein
VIAATRIARQRVARRRATPQSVPRAGAIVAVRKAASITAITNAPIARA